MTSLVGSCIYCEHLDRETLLRGGGLRCAAYPDGAPGRIIEGIELHLAPYPGDHGIQFVPKENVPTHVRERYLGYHAKMAREAVDDPAASAAGAQAATDRALAAEQAAVAARLASDR